MAVWTRVGKMLGIVPHDPGKKEREALEAARLARRIEKAVRQEELSSGFKELIERRAARDRKQG